jgi:hypothetical protein
MFSYRVLGVSLGLECLFLFVFAVKTASRAWGMLATATGGVLIKSCAYENQGWKARGARWIKTTSYHSLCRKSARSWGGGPGGPGMLRPAPWQRRR